MQYSITSDELKTRHSEEVQDLKRKLRITEQNLVEYRKAHGSIKTLFEDLRDAIHLLPSVKVSYEPPPSSRTKIPCGVCLLICDTHYGAVQNASEIEGFGEYSPQICEARSMKFVDEVVKWTKLNRHGYQLDRAHVLVAGDLISGDIHLELQVTNAFPAPQQVIGSARLLANQIMYLAPHFKEVVVHFITEDNHARLTKKPQAKEAGINSFNYLVGMFAKSILTSQSNVRFNIYPQYEVIIDVEGRKYLLMHGHNIQGWMGIPYYSVERKVAKEAIKRMNIPDKRFHKIILGHFHHPISHPVYWIGGSVSGTDAYDHKNGRYATPSQTSWLVHSLHGEFSRIDWNL